MAKPESFKHFSSMRRRSPLLRLSVRCPRQWQWDSDAGWARSLTRSRAICDEPAQSIFASRFRKRVTRNARDSFVNVSIAWGVYLDFSARFPSRSREELKQLVEVQGWENLEAAKETCGQKIDSLHGSYRSVGIDQFRILAFWTSVHFSGAKNRQSANRATRRSQFAQGLVIKQSTNSPPRARC